VFAPPDLPFSGLKAAEHGVSTQVPLLSWKPSLHAPQVAEPGLQLLSFGSHAEGPGEQLNLFSSLHFFFAMTPHGSVHSLAVEKTEHFESSNFPASAPMGPESVEQRGYADDPGSN